MKISQDTKTGKLLFELQHDEVASSEDYFKALSDLVADKIAPDVFALGNRQDELVALISSQHQVICALTENVLALLFLANDLSETAQMLPKHEKNLKNKLEVYKKLLQHGTSTID